MSEYLLFISILIIAFLYASIGHGGASGYIALFTLFNFEASQIRSTALILNIIVSIIAFSQFNKYYPLNRKLFLPLICSSIPFAFIGGTISINSHYYNYIIALVLLLAIFNLLNKKPSEEIEIVTGSLLSIIILGASIGFLSGLIGIGGGVLFTPIMLYLRWASMKQAATISALFIFVNSIAGLSGTFFTHVYLSNDVYICVILVIIGAIAGSYFGSVKWNLRLMKYILVFVLAIAVIKLVTT